MAWIQYDFHHWRPRVHRGQHIRMCLNWASASDELSRQRSQHAPLRASASQKETKRKKKRKMPRSAHVGQNKKARSAALKSIEARRCRKGRKEGESERSSKTCFISSQVPTANYCQSAASLQAADCQHK